MKQFLSGDFELRTLYQLLDVNVFGLGGLLPGWWLLARWGLHRLLHLLPDVLLLQSLEFVSPFLFDTTYTPPMLLLDPLDSHRELIIQPLLKYPQLILRLL